MSLLAEGQSHMGTYELVELVAKAKGHASHDPLRAKLLVTTARAKANEMSVFPMSTSEQVVARRMLEHDIPALEEEIQRKKMEIGRFASLGQQLIRMPEGVPMRIKSVSETANIVAPPLPVQPRMRAEFLKHKLDHLLDLFRWTADEIMQISRHDGNPMWLPFLIRLCGTIGGQIAGVISATNGLPKPIQNEIVLRSVTLFNFVVAFSEFSEGMAVALIGGEQMKRHMRPIDPKLVEALRAEIVKDPGLTALKVIRKPNAPRGAKPWQAFTLVSRGFRLP